MKTLYRKDLYNMSQDKLKEIIVLNDLSIDIENYIQADEVIEKYEDNISTIFETIEDDILDDVYNGNWTDGTNKMLKNFINPNELMNYIEELREEQGDEAYSFFTLSSASALTSLYYQQREA